MEDDGDPESRGVCPLETLSKVAAEQAAEAEELERPKNRTVTSVEEPERTSTPLVPLTPSHKRPRSRSREPSKALRTTDSGVQKVKAPSGQLSGQFSQQDLSEGPGSPTGNQGLQEQRRSAPERGNPNLEKELRGSKSAPDLSAHALAAIRSIQAGTLQLDSRMRNKIAAAARRVLQARELKRRASSENVAQAAASLGEPSAAEPQSPQPGASNMMQALHPPGPNPTTGAQPIESLGANGPALPHSLATAAAIARGEALPLGSPLPRASQRGHPLQGSVDQGGTTMSASGSPASSSYHHPTPSITLQPVSSPTSSYRPFTVTTGVPRYAQGLGPSAMAPSTPQAPSQMLQMSPQPTRTSSLALSAGDPHVVVHTPMSE